MRIAVIGTGVSGLVAAHHLHRDHELTVFEADERIGGHVHTVDVEVDGERHAVDTGFIVYNERTYPGFSALLRELDVATQPSEMSFSVSDPAVGLEYRTTNLNTLFAQRRNLLRPAFLELLSEIGRFARVLRRTLKDETDTAAAERLPAPGTRPSEVDESLAAFVQAHGFSDTFVRRFLVPIGASIWSADPDTYLRYPVRTYARFMQNHGLLGIGGKPRWRTVTGGARTYVDALVAPFADRIRVGSPVRKLTATHDARTGPCVEVLTGDGLHVFDRVIVATHSDQALRLLADATPAEREILSAIRYQRNVATLHTDPSLLPRTPRARAAWNYLVDGADGRVSVTYWMNALQRIRSSSPLLVTLNGGDAIDPRTVHAEVEYDHPVFDAAACAAQRRRFEIQGERGVFFVGAYWGYGFHEDGVQSAAEVAALVAGAR
jgi:predicted NAD/FAD-binding protein